MKSDPERAEHLALPSPFAYLLSFIAPGGFTPRGAGSALEPYFEDGRAGPYFLRRSYENRESAYAA
jgi:hypothetical protein